MSFHADGQRFEQARQLVALRCRERVEEAGFVGEVQTEQLVGEPSSGRGESDDAAAPVGGRRAPLDVALMLQPIDALGRPAGRDEHDGGQLAWARLMRRTLATKRSQQVEVAIGEAGSGERRPQLVVDEDSETGEPGDHQHRRRVEVRPDLGPPLDDRANPVPPVDVTDRIIAHHNATIPSMEGNYTLYTVGLRSTPRRTQNATMLPGTVQRMPLEGEYAPSPSDWACKQVETFEASGGAEANTLQGKPIIVLTTRGKKTGKLRKTPLMRVERDGSYAVVASLGGAPKHPVWYYNIVADPHVELQDGSVKRDMVAREVTGEEKALWWDRAVAAWPDYAEYQKKTDRQIPVFVLDLVDR